ncbi:hypothetical protein [Dongia sp.]|uniref:hypothetical protein n=1 Tax=Dongia sp. TaxID=1977262 RepID=UPI0035B007FC
MLRNQASGQATGADTGLTIRQSGQKKAEIETRQIGQRRILLRNLPTGEKWGKGARVPRLRAALATMGLP